MALVEQIQAMVSEDSSLPQVDVLGLTAILTHAFEEFSIPLGVDSAAFLANAAHESNHFTAFEEGLNYRWDVLMKQWPRRFDLATALRVGRIDSKQLEVVDGVTCIRWNGSAVRANRKAANQEEIANIAYGGRFGNQNPGDGWKYRGRGIFQLTFYDNYHAYATDIGDLSVVEAPEQVAELEHACRSACWYWSSRGLSAVLHNRGFSAVCQAINGGNIGMAERMNNFQAIRNL